MFKDPTPSLIEHFWLMQMLVNFGAKRNSILYFLIHSLSKHRFSTTAGADIYRRYKQIQHFFKRNWNIARNLMCFILNVIIARQNFSAHLIGSSSSYSKFSYRQNMY